MHLIVFKSLAWKGLLFLWRLFWKRLSRNKVPNNHFLKSVQKQSYLDVLQSRCSWKFHNYETPVLESLLLTEKVCRSEFASYSERKIAKHFEGFAPGPHWGGLTALPQTPRLHNGFCPRHARQKTGTPKKLLDMALADYVLKLKIYWFFLFLM